MRPVVMLDSMPGFDLEVRSQQERMAQTQRSHSMLFVGQHWLPVSPSDSAPPLAVCSFVQTALFETSEASARTVWLSSFDAHQVDWELVSEGSSLETGADLSEPLVLVLLPRAVASRSDQCPSAEKTFAVVWALALSHMTSLSPCRDRLRMTSASLIDAIGAVLDCRSRAGQSHV